MTFDLDLLGMASASASHAGKRQQVIAENIAQADVPGFKARDIKPFAEFFEAPANGLALKQTRSAHLGGTNVVRGADPHEIAGLEASPNGNTVSLEAEMTKAAGVRHDYELALGIYSKSLDILRKSLGRR